MPARFILGEEKMRQLVGDIPDAIRNDFAYVAEELRNAPIEDIRALRQLLHINKEKIFLAGNILLGLALISTPISLCERYDCKNPPPRLSLWNYNYAFVLPVMTVNTIHRLIVINIELPLIHDLILNEGVAREEPAPLHRVNLSGKEKLHTMFLASSTMALGYYHILQADCTSTCAVIMLLAPVYFLGVIFLDKERGWVDIVETLQAREAAEERAGADAGAGVGAAAAAGRG